nr:MAG TPA: terminase small subunit [Caudoviricetes sp.]
MSKFKDWLEGDGLLKLEGWARDGLTDEQISRNMGIAYSTFREWKKKYSAFSAVLKRSKDVVDREVENALFKRAMGYKYDEVTYERGEEVKRVTKEVAPDTTAQIFWLKNRKPAEWRDKIEQQQTVTIQDDGFLEALKGTIKDDWDETS